MTQGQCGKVGVGDGVYGCWCVGVGGWVYVSVSRCVWDRCGGCRCGRGCGYR